MGNNRFMVVSEEKGIIAMNPSYVEQKGKISSSTCLGHTNSLSWNTKRKKMQEMLFLK